MVEAAWTDVDLTAELVEGDVAPEFDGVAELLAIGGAATLTEEVGMIGGGDCDSANMGM